MSDIERLRTWLRRAAPRPLDLIKAIFMASLASLAGTGLFIGAIALLVESSHRPGLRAIGAFLIAIELVAFLRSPLRFAERMSTHRLGFAAVVRWRQWLMESVGAWEYSRWQSFATGDLLERSLRDTDELQDLWLRGVIPATATFVTLALSDLGVSLLAPSGHWWMVATALVVVQAAAAAVLLSRLTVQIRYDRALRSSRGAYVAQLVSSRAAAPEIEQLRASDFLRGRLERAQRHVAGAEDDLRATRRRDSAVVVVATLAALAVVAVAHPRSAALWVVVASLVALATFDAMMSVRGAVRIAVAVSGGAERLDELASTTPPPRRAWPPDTAVRLSDVPFGAPGASSRLDAVFAPGRRVAISGASGSGKSTLLRALARLDVPRGGSITIGDTPLDDIAEDQLREHLVLVPSEPGLLSGYVRDVVGMGHLVSDADLDVLARLGMRVELNDQWAELSRGERQRVALVRALVRRPRILLLDEPTSALGAEETGAVLDVLSTLSATVVIASHDPLVLAWCDEVIDLSAAALS